MKISEAIQEQWRPVAEWDQFYMVSDHGRVKSLDRMIYRSDGTSYLNPGRIIKQHQCGSRAKFGDGYMFVGFHRDSFVKRYYVHRLVAAAFLPPPIGAQVNHIDLNKRNNHLSNLEWATAKSNAAHAIKNGRYVLSHLGGRTLATNNPSRSKKLTIEKVTEIRRLCALGVYQKEVGAMFGICQATVSSIHRMKIWNTTPCIDAEALQAYEKTRCATDALRGEMEAA